MKINKIMFVIAGIINSIIGGIVFLLSFTILLMKSVVRTLLTTGNACEVLVEEIVAGDESYKFLQSYTQDQVIDYVWGMVAKFMVVVLLIAIVIIAFAIINFIFSKKCNGALGRNKKIGTTLVVFSWVLMTLNIANIFTTLGVYLKPRKKQENIISGPTDGRGRSRY